MQRQYVSFPWFSRVGAEKARRSIESPGDISRTVMTVATPPQIGPLPDRHRPARRIGLPTGHGARSAVIAVVMRDLPRAKADRRAGCPSSSPPHRTRERRSQAVGVDAPPRTPLATSKVLPGPYWHAVFKAVPGAFSGSVLLRGPSQPHEHRDGPHVAAHVHEVEVATYAIDVNDHANNVESLAGCRTRAASHSDAVGCTDATPALGATRVVRSHRVEYLRPAFAGDHVEVRIRVADFRRASSSASTSWCAGAMGPSWPGGVESGLRGHREPPAPERPGAHPSLLRRTGAGPVTGADSMAGEGSAAFAARQRDPSRYGAEHAGVLGAGRLLLPHLPPRPVRGRAAQRLPLPAHPPPGPAPRLGRPPALAGRRRRLPRPGLRVHRPRLRHGRLLPRRPPPRHRRDAGGADGRAARRRASASSSTASSTTSAATSGRSATCGRTASGRRTATGSPASTSAGAARTATRSPTTPGRGTSTW